LDLPITDNAGEIGYTQAMTRPALHIFALSGMTLLIIGLHYLLLLQFSTRVIFEELFYLPLILGVLRFGSKGVVFTYLGVSAAYLPFFFHPWSETTPQLMERALHLLFSGVFVAIAYRFAQREREQQSLARQERFFSGLGQAATVIVHDLKNPLITIEGFARRIQEGKGDLASAAAVILESTATMQRITGDVLAFARPPQMHFELGELGVVVRTAADSCSAKARKSEVTLAVRLPDKPVICSADYFQLERALVNLIDNALDASAPGMLVTISCAAHDETLEITINDQGSGMDADTLEHLFTLTFTTKNEGTGFGVPIAKKIIEAHGGTLQVSSRLQQGTCVLIFMPLRRTTD